MVRTVAWRHQGAGDKTPLHYVDCGLDDVYLVNGYTIEHTPYGEGLAIKKLDELHKAIGCYLVNQRKVLSVKELRFLRKQMDLTQSDLGRLIGLSSQQVARWEKGKNEISGPADRLLRSLYMEHVGGKLDLHALITMLEEMGTPMTQKAVFEKTSHGWKYNKAA